MASTCSTLSNSRVCPGCPRCPPRWRPLRRSSRAFACCAFAATLSLDGGCDELRELRLFWSRSRLTSSASACTSGGVCAQESAEMRSSGGFGSVGLIVHYLTINDHPRHHPERIPAWREGQSEKVNELLR